MIVMCRTGQRLLRHTVIVVGLATAVGLAACRSAGTPVLSSAELHAGVSVLSRPLTGDLAALYRLTVPSSGGLRLSILTHGRAGRLTVSEPFGSAISLAAWGVKTQLFDLRHGCRLEATQRQALFFEGRMPLEELARLLGGRLPSGPGDRIVVQPDGQVVILGHAWSCRVRLARNPWRVTYVEGPAGTAEARWHIRLGQHTSSLPGFLRAEWGHRKWAELKLVRLQWNTVRALPPVPELPPCRSRE